MTSCGETSDGLAPKKPITSHHLPNRKRPPRPRRWAHPPRGRCLHVHPLTSSRLQHPTSVTRIPGPRWRLAGRRSCRLQTRALPDSSGSPAAASVNRLPVPCRRGGGPTVHRRGRHATPGRFRRPTEVPTPPCKRRGTRRPSVSRPGSSVRPCLQAQLRNRPPSRGPLADTHPATRWGNHRPAHTPNGSGPTSWFQRAPSRRVADGDLRSTRPRSDW